MKKNILEAFLLLTLLTNVYCSITVDKSDMSFNSRLAGFGPAFETDDGFLGQLVSIAFVKDAKNDTFGCTPALDAFSIRAKSKMQKAFSSGMRLLPRQQSDDLPANWIPLVQRGVCSFVEKVRIMQALGASAVVVGDNVDRDSLITMYGTGDLSDIAIPSVFVSKATFVTLSYLLEQEKLVSNASVPSLEVRLTYTAVDSSFIDILLTTVLTPVLVVLLIWAFWRILQHERSKVLVAPAETVASIPTKTFRRAETADNDPMTCVICLEDFEDGDELRKLACSHEFHMSCLDPWLKQRSRLCPICKRSTVNEPDQDGSTHEDRHDEQASLLANAEPLSVIVSDCDSQEAAPMIREPASPKSIGGASTLSALSSRNDDDASSNFSVSPPKQIQINIHSTSDK